MGRKGANEFQLMPELSAEEYASLKADIERNGVLVPVVVDQHDRILDGYSRVKIAAELGIEYPREVHRVANDKQARELALTYNLARRHLNREQKQQLLKAEMEREPNASNKEIARRLKMSPTTVAAHRPWKPAEGVQVGSPPEPRVIHTKIIINKPDADPEPSETLVRIKVEEPLEPLQLRTPKSTGFVKSAARQLLDELRRQDPGTDSAEERDLLGDVIAVIEDAARIGRCDHDR